MQVSNSQKCTLHCMGVVVVGGGGGGGGGGQGEGGYNLLTVAPQCNAFPYLVHSYFTPEAITCTCTNMCTDLQYMAQNTTAMILTSEDVRDAASKRLLNRTRWRSKLIYRQNIQECSNLQHVTKS